MSPLESTIQILLMASSRDVPSSSMAMTKRVAMPMEASPAPWNRYVWSDNLVFVILMAAITPATATEAVPGRKDSEKKLHSTRTKLNIDFPHLLHKNSKRPTQKMRGMPEHKYYDDKCCYLTPL